MLKYSFSRIQVTRLFDDPNEVSISLPVKNLEGNIESIMSITVNKRLLEKYNFTVEQVKKYECEICEYTLHMYEKKGMLWEFNLKVTVRS